MFEADDLHGLADCEITMRETMEAAGITFPFVGAHPRRAPNTVTYAPPATPVRRGASAHEPNSLASMWLAVRALLERALGV